MDFNALEEVQDDLDKRGGDFEKVKVRRANELTVDLRMRILPPLDNMEGKYFVEKKTWFINSKPYTSPSFIGKRDPIQDEVDLINDGDDQNLKDMIGYGKGLDDSSEFLLNCVFFDDDEGEQISQDSPGVFGCPISMIKSINKIVTHPRFRKNGNNVTDRIGGMDIYAEKEGVKKKTKYSATPCHASDFKIPESFYDESKFTDLVKWTKAQIRSEAYLEAVVRNYFYGEEMPEDEDKEDSSSPKSKTDTPKSKPKKTGKMTLEELDEDSDLENGLGDEATPFKGEDKPEKSANAPTKKKKSLLDDINNMD